jgi:hypothetical protein
MSLWSTCIIHSLGVCGDHLDCAQAKCHGETRGLESWYEACSVQHAIEERFEACISLIDLQAETSVAAWNSFPLLSSHTCQYQWAFSQLQCGSCGIAKSQSAPTTGNVLGSFASNVLPSVDMPSFDGIFGFAPEVRLSDPFIAKLHLDLRNFAPVLTLMTFTS